MIHGVSRMLCFEHIGVFDETGDIYANVRDQKANINVLFLIKRNEEQGYCRNEQNDRWRLMSRKDFSSLLQSLCAAIVQKHAVLRIDGNQESIINRNNYKGGNEMGNKMKKVGIVCVAALVCCGVFATACFATSEDAAQKIGKKKNQALPAHRSRLVFNKIKDSTSLLAAVKAKAEDLNKSEKPGYVRVRVYDAEGNLRGWRFEQITRDHSGRIVKKTVVTYNKKGKKIGNRTVKYSYTLDENNKAVSATATIKKDGEAAGTKEIAFRRDENGKIVETETIVKDGAGNITHSAIKTFVRDSEGRITGCNIARKDKDGNIIETEVRLNTLDENGKVTEQTSVTTNAKGITTSESVTNYKNGVAKSTTKKFYSEDGHVSRKVIMNYA